MTTQPLKHLALVMDGNRRWARERNSDTYFGHLAGRDAARRAVEYCVKRSISYLSLYTLSLENLHQRPPEEVNHILTIMIEGISQELPELIKQGVCVRFVGDRDQFPTNVLASVDAVERETKDLNTLHLRVMFCYGAKQELMHVVKAIAQQVKNGLLAIDDIDQKTMQNTLWTYDVPDPDLIIRSGKVMRLSNFLLYQAAYAEIKFLDCLWPDVTDQHLDECIQEYQRTKQNFGR